MSRMILPGQPSPLGAHWDGLGVNFAVESEHATALELCLFDRPTDPVESTSLALPGRTGKVFHGYVPGLGPGAAYGLRAQGPWEPAKGHWFNQQRLLMDPYARMLTGALDPTAPLCAWRAPSTGIAPPGDFVPDLRDSAPGVPRCLVVDPRFDWGHDRPPARSWSETVIYETHVRSMTKLHPEVPEALRGSYLGLCSEPVMAHLEKLGVTAIELLPVHEIGDEPFVLARGMSNHWGYSTLGFFAPASRYASDRAPGAALREFKTMVRTLHARGFEVLLDVVYNHTCEGNHLGPSVLFRGLDNANYYLLSEQQRAYYMDYTGTGNVVALSQPAPLQLTLDSLRYWVTEMHVDGFRFDLAVTLGRTPHNFDAHAPLFEAMLADPVLREVKWIAEAWDVGPGGYQVGGFAPPWREWNGRYRDAVRRYWRRDPGQRAELASRLAGSADLYERPGRDPTASINFVTAHDGFTLRDLVSFKQKHNESNGEGNRDGTDSNDSANYGVEGPTEDPLIETLRARQRRNLLATLLLSQGVPMLLAGDEFGNSQYGNNNPWCQDNDISWLHWPAADDAESQQFLAWVRCMAALRRAHPVLRRERFFRGRKGGAHNAFDLLWLRPDGAPMSPQDWHDDKAHSLAALLNDEGTPAQVLLVLMNQGPEAATQDLAPLASYGTWRVLVDTRMSECWDEAHAPPAPAWYVLAPQSLVVLKPG